MRGQYAELVERANAYIGPQSVTNGGHLIVELVSALTTLTQQQKQHEDLALPIANGGASTTASGTHSPEPWTFGMLYIARWSQVRYDHIAMHPSGEVQPEGGQWEADARRIVACVNACAGVTTKDLEDGTAAVFVKIKIDGTAPETSTRSADE